MARGGLFGRARYRPSAEVVLSHAALGAIVGLGATWVMSRVSAAMYAQEDPDARRREDEARGHEAPTERAVERLADTFLDRPATERERARYGEVVHYGIGAGAGAMYGALHAATPGAGLLRGPLFGLGFFLVFDEGFNPLLGLSARPQAYPWQAHARGLAAHLVFGATAEAAMRLLARPALGAVGLSHHVAPRRARRAQRKATPTTRLRSSAPA